VTSAGVQACNRGGGNKNWGVSEANTLGAGFRGQHRGTLNQNIQKKILLRGNVKEGKKADAKTLLAAEGGTAEKSKSKTQKGVKNTTSKDIHYSKKFHERYPERKPHSEREPGNGQNTQERGTDIEPNTLMMWQGQWGAK